MVMLYKLGTELVWEGKTYDTKIVAENEVEELLAEGWHKHVNDIPSGEDNQATREELELKATELNIEFNESTRDSTLLKKINAALNVD